MVKKSNEVTNGFSRSKFDLRKESEGSPASYHGLRWDFLFCTSLNAHSSPVQTVQPPAGEGGQGGEDKQQQQEIAKHPRGGDHP